MRHPLHLGLLLVGLIVLFGCFRSNPVLFHPPTWLQGSWRSTQGQILRVTDRDFLFQTDGGAIPASSYFSSIQEERATESSYPVRGNLAWPYFLARGTPLTVTFVLLDPQTIEVSGLPGMVGRFTRVSSP